MHEQRQLSRDGELRTAIERMQTKAREIFAEAVMTAKKGQLTRSKRQTSRSGLPEGRCTFVMVIQVGSGTVVVVVVVVVVVCMASSKATQETRRSDKRGRSRDSLLPVRDRVCLGRLSPYPSY